MYLHFFLVSFPKCLAIKTCLGNPDFSTDVASFTIKYFQTKNNVHVSICFKTIWISQLSLYEL